MTPSPLLKSLNTVCLFMKPSNNANNVSADTQQARPRQRHPSYPAQGRKQRQQEPPHKPTHSCFYQLSGHSECFKKGPRPDTILKKLSGNEQVCLNRLASDSLAPFVPQIYGVTERDGQSYLEMQNLLSSFRQPSAMDVKMGCRTYREEELNSALRDVKLRTDMYDKMIEIDEHEPTVEERQAKAVTKPRYMVWRETASSTAKLGFRIEAMLFADGTIDKEFKTLKFQEQIMESIERFCRNRAIRFKYLKRLIDLRQALTQSDFFANYELIGSSLLFVHDEQDDTANIWLIDFAKTYPLPNNTVVNHRKQWELGNHEDGYLTGVDNLIQIFQSLNMSIDRQLGVALDKKTNKERLADNTTKPTTTSSTTTTKTVVFHRTLIKRLSDHTGFL